MMRAEDVVYSFNRLIGSEELALSTYLTNVSEVEALDPLTVRVRTKSRLAILLNKLYNVFIIPNGSSAEELAVRVNGTGPYKLAKWEKGSLIQMERNEKYWGKKPALRKVNYYLNQSPRQAVQNLVSGKCQLAQYDSKKFEAAVSSLGHFEIVRHDNFFLKYLSYDVSRNVTPYSKVRPNPFKNILVRQAIHIGIDRDRLVSGLPSYAVPAVQPVPAFVFGYNPNIRPPTSNRVEAKRLLAQAGFPNGFEVTLHERQILEETGVLIKNQLERIGIRVQLKALSDEEFFEALDKGNFTFFLSRVGATIGDASDILEPQFHSKDLSRHFGVRNYIGYRNPIVNQAIEESAGILKPEERRSVLQKIMSILMEDLPWVPLYIDQDVYAIDKAFSWQPRPDSYILAYEIGLK